MEEWSDAMIVAVVPGIVEVAKRAGLPVRWSGVASIIAACALIALRDLGGGDYRGASTFVARAAWWMLHGMLLGLAAAGLYSQARLARPPVSDEPVRAPRNNASEQG